MAPKQNLGKLGIGLLAAGLLFTLSGCGKKNDAPKTPQAQGPVEVDAVVMAPSYLEKSTQVNGSILANEFAELRPEASGRLVFLNVKEGALVSEGTVVARLFNDDLQATLRRHKANLGLAESTLSRIEKLLEIDGVNRQEYDQAKAQVEGVQADIAFTEAQIRKTIVTAPFSGTLGLRNVSNGAYVSPQTLICTIQQTGSLKVDFNVPENIASLVRVGDSLKVEVEGVKEAVTGKIVAIEPQLNQATRNLKVRAIIPSKPGISPGAFAKVRLDAGSTKDALVLPTQAIVPDTRFKKVFVIRGGKAESVNVETGFRTENVVEITSGLQKGDTVAATGVLFLRPGADAKVRKILSNNR